MDERAEGVDAPASQRGLRGVCEPGKPSMLWIQIRKGQRGRLNGVLEKGIAWRIAANDAMRDDIGRLQTPRHRDKISNNGRDRLGPAAPSRLISRRCQVGGDASTVTARAILRSSNSKARADAAAHVQQRSSNALRV